MAKPHPPVVVDQQDPRGERVGVRKPLAPADPAPQRLKRFHELQVSVRGAIERPALTEQAPAAVVLGGNLQTDRARSLFRNRHAGRRDPYARQRAAETRILQRLSRGVAILAVTDQQKLKASGPVGRLRIVDMFGRGIKGLPSLLHQPIEAVAADPVALEPTVGGEPRHRGAHYAAVDVDRSKEFQQRSEPDRTATRHDRIAEQRDDDGAGARGFALELFDDAGKRMRHPQRIARFWGFTTTPASSRQADLLEHDGLELNRRQRSGHLAPLAGRGRSRRLRVRGTLRESERGESLPHPNPLRASFARLDPAQAGRGRSDPRQRNRFYLAGSG